MQFIPISVLARQITAEIEDKNQEAEHGKFNLDQYTPQEQMALLTMRFNDPLAKAVLLKLKHSTVAGMDFVGIVNKRLAVRNARGFHDFTPRGRWVSGKVTTALAQQLNVTVPRERRIWTDKEKRRYQNAHYNWANR